MKTIQAAGGVVKTSDGQVLMIFRNGVWDLPKGKVEFGESVEVAAIREVEEETGLHGVKIERSLGTTVHTYKLDDEPVEKTTWWYLMGLESQTDPYSLSLRPQLEEGITDISWKSVEQACKVAGYENLITILNRL